MPGDVSVVGFDDLFLSSYTVPSLTTIQQPKHQMGCLAAKMLLELLSGGKPQNQLILEGRLVVRQSTSPPGAA
ncbi:MAG: substrate-binding domain-containing protein, partial [Smithellaceae bacterium]